MVSLRQKRRRDGRLTQDDRLPFLTLDEAGRVRHLVQQAFAECGREVTVYPDYLRDDQGSEFGLWNVAAACHADPRGERAWPTVVAEYVRNLLEHVDQGSLEGFEDEDVWSSVYVKLSPAEALPSREGLAYLDETVPGLVDALVVDLPHAVSWLTDSEVRRFGGKAALREAGLANLRMLPVGERKHMRAPDGGTFEVLLGESVYTASRALVMEDLLTRVLGLTVDGGHGVLAAMATRNQIAIHVIHDRSVIPSLRLMARFAVAGFTDGTGPLSPDVLWWRDGRWTRVTRRETGGTISMIENPDFISMIERVAG